MSGSIKVFENSLREYLINMQTDSYNRASKIEYKYNNLKVYMDPKRSRTPHFWVSYNIVAACYTIDNVTKIAGNVGVDDKFIIMWANRENINGELRKHWEYTLRLADREEEEKEENSEENEENVSEEDDEFNYASEIITGSGAKENRKIFNLKNKKFKVKRIKLKSIRVKNIKISKKEVI